MNLVDISLWRRSSECQYLPEEEEREVVAIRGGCFPIESQRESLLIGPDMRDLNKVESQDYASARNPRWTEDTCSRRILHRKPWPAGRTCWIEGNPASILPSQYAQELRCNPERSLFFDPTHLGNNRKEMIREFPRVVLYQLEDHPTVFEQVSLPREAMTVVEGKLEQVIRCSCDSNDEFPICDSSLASPAGRWILVRLASGLEFAGAYSPESLLSAMRDSRYSPYGRYARARGQ